MCRVFNVYVLGVLVEVVGFGLNVYLLILLLFLIVMMGGGDEVCLLWNLFIN